MDADLGNDHQLILIAPQECLHVSGPPSHLLSAFGADAQPGPGDEKLAKALFYISKMTSLLTCKFHRGGAHFYTGRFAWVGPSLPNTPVS